MSLSELFSSMLLMVMLILLQCDCRALRGIQQRNEYSFLSKVNRDSEEDGCVQLPPPILTEILGPAFNSRYMSIEQPPSLDDSEAPGTAGRNNPSGKRGTEAFPPFYVDDKYALELSNKPAWEVSHVSESIPSASVPVAPRTRRDLFKDILDDMDQHQLRSVPAVVASAFGGETRETRSYSKGRSRKGSTFSGAPRPWECEAKIRWIDLGQNYFPRFLRTVECTRQNCWYGHYTCQPRSFTVKILRRRTGECVRSDRLRRIGVDGLPGELRELWVWEERAVNFCCDCAPAF